MHFSKAGTACLLASVLVADAQNLQDSQPPDAARLLRELEAAEKKHQSSESARRHDVAALLRQAFSSGSAAASAYEDAVKNTAFEGKASSSKAFADWKSKNADLLRSEAMQAAVAFHARYLLISLQSCDEGDREKAASAFFEYSRDYAGKFSEDGLLRLPEPADKLLRNPVAQGPFCRWLFLSDRLPEEDAWEPTAGHLDGILEKNVRGVWRTTADAKLLATWDLQISFLKSRAEASELDFELEKFENIDKPRLLFGRAKDRAWQGQPNQATKEVFELIKRYPHHPHWPEWAEWLRTNLQNESSPTRPTP
jgi:hypothetical protein